MSENSLPDNGLALKFDTKQCVFFDVEYADQGNDIIYHFWPPSQGTWFVDGAEPELFGKALENGFRAVLPDDADVRAEYTSPRESLALLRYGESTDKEAKPRETYYVRVVGWATNPMCDRFLKNEVFTHVEQAVRKSL
jgi:hypothetical protein